MIEYYRFCTPDSIFYRRPDATESVADPFALTVPNDWQYSTDSDWSYCIPADYEIPVQGWKLHISATPGNAKEILNLATRYLFDNGTAFKYLPSKRSVFESNAKYYDRVNSGKFITIYPMSDQSGEEIARSLQEILKNFRGPHILSDLQLFGSVVHARYGAFVRIERNGYGGSTGYGMFDSNGELVSDDRSLFEELPGPPVSTPKYYREAFSHYKSKDQIVPFHATEALAFPNGGGVYRANLPESGRAVVVKEGRRFAGLDALHEDAYTRVRNEYEVLSSIDVPGIPEAIDYIEVGDNAYLIEDVAPGESFTNWVGSRNPAFNGDIADTHAASNYIESATTVLERLVHTVGGLWRAGYAHNDLQPNNVLVDDDLNVSLIDFEATSSLSGSQSRALVLGTPGFFDPSLGPGQSQDAFAMHRLAFYAIAPAVNPLDLSASAYRRILLMVSHTFGDTAEKFLNRVSEVVKEQIGPESPAWSELESSPPWKGGLFHSNNGFVHPSETLGQKTTRDIASSSLDELVDSTFEYFDEPGIRGFPGDVERFTGDGHLNLRTGAWGVLGAATSIKDAPPHVVDQITTDTYRHVWSSSGYLNGITGVIDTADSMGFSHLASEILGEPRFVEDTPLSRPSPDITLSSGAAGRLFGIDRIIDRGTIQITPALEGRAEADGELLRATIDTLTHDKSIPAELMKDGRSFLEGVSGVVWALCSLKNLSPYKNERTLGEACKMLLETELQRFSTFGTDPALYLVDDRRYLPYLGRGSLGVMFACIKYRQRFGDDSFDDAILRMSKVLNARFTVVGGLFFGRAGLLWSSAALPDTFLHDQDREVMLRRHVIGLRAHFVEDKGRESLAGEHNLRASLDLMTGSAGAILSLKAVLNRLDGAPVALDQWLPATLSGK